MTNSLLKSKWGEHAFDKHDLIEISYFIVVSQRGQFTCDRCNGRYVGVVGDELIGKLGGWVEYGLCFGENGRRTRHIIESILIGDCDIFKLICKIIHNLGRNFAITIISA